jgi:hypothetical protein
MAISTVSRSSLPLLRWTSKTNRTSALTSLSTSCRIAFAVFSLRRQRILDRPCAADFLIDLEQFTAQFPEMVKCFDFALRFAQLGGRGEGFTDCLSIHFAGEAEVGSVARLVWLMTTALRFTAAAADGGDRTAAKISQIDDAGQNSLSLPFERKTETLAKKETLPPTLSCRTPAPDQPAA